MSALGRVASALVLLAASALVLVATVVPGLEHVGSVHVLDWLGVTLYLAAPVTWLSAIVHWATRYPREGRRRAWGVAIVLGFVPGAMAYWLAGVPRSS